HSAHVRFTRGSDIATLWAHMHDPPPSVHAAAPDLPARLDPVLERALAKAPEDRQRNCGAIARELAAAASPAAETATGGANDRRWLAAGIAAVAGMVVAAG